MAVTSSAELLPATLSKFVPATLTVLLTEGPTPPSTATVNVMSGAAPTARPARVHVTISDASLQVQPVPVADTKLRPVPLRSSVTVTEPISSLGPKFSTDSV